MSLKVTDMAPQELIHRPLADCGHVKLPNVRSATSGKTSSKLWQATRGDIKPNPIRGYDASNATHKGLQTRIDALQQQKEETIRKIDNDIEALQSALSILAEQ